MATVLSTLCATAIMVYLAQYLLFDVGSLSLQRTLLVLPAAIVFIFALTLASQALDGTHREAASILGTCVAAEDSTSTEPPLDAKIETEEAGVEDVSEKVTPVPVRSTQETKQERERSRRSKQKVQKKHRQWLKKQERKKAEQGRDKAAEEQEMAKQNAPTTLQQHLDELKKEVAEAKYEQEEEIEQIETAQNWAQVRSRRLKRRKQTPVLTVTTTAATSVEQIEGDDSRDYPIIRESSSSTQTQTTPNTARTTTATTTTSPSTRLSWTPTSPAVDSIQVLPARDLSTLLSAAVANHAHKHQQQQEEKRSKEHEILAAPVTVKQQVCPWVQARLDEMEAWETRTLRRCSRKRGASV